MKPNVSINKRTKLSKFIIPNRLTIWRLRYDYYKKRYGIIGSIYHLKKVGFRSFIAEADKDNLTNIVLALGIVGGILAIFYGVSQTIRSELTNRKLDALEREIVGRRW